MVQLILELKSISAGETAVIPDLFYVSARDPVMRVGWLTYCLQDTMSRENVILNQPKRHWFTESLEDEGELRYRDRRLRSIWRGSMKCTVEAEHETGWKDTVHAKLLDDAIEDLPAVSRRNM